MVTVSTSAVQERKKVSLPIDLPPVWSEQEQLEHAADLVVEGNFTRWDPRFDKLWFTRDQQFIPVSQMSLEHMCATIALWLQKEFSEAMATRWTTGAYPRDRVNPYQSFEHWMKESRAMARTVALPRMVERLNALPNGEDTLRKFTQNAASEILQKLEPAVEQVLIRDNVFF